MQQVSMARSAKQLSLRLSLAKRTHDTERTDNPFPLISSRPVASAAPNPELHQIPPPVCETSEHFLERQIMRNP